MMAWTSMLMRPGELLQNNYTNTAYMVYNEVDKQTEPYEEEL
jgi:hypothetical protein